MKENWVKTLFSFAGHCKIQMYLSVLCAVISVIGGFIPFFAVYKIIRIFIDRHITIQQILFLSLVGMVGYLVKILFYGISTVLSHISAYTILEELRLKIADCLLAAPLGEVMNLRMGYIKDVIMDKVEGIEPPLAHLIPELSSNLILPVVIFIWMFTIEWRMGFSILIAPALAMVPMFFMMKSYNSRYNEYMEASNHVNNVIIEYVEGIEIVKAFNQSTSSYKKFENAIQSFKGFTFAWFQSVWKTKSLTFSILPTTMLGVLPVGLALYQQGEISPSELAMCLILSLSIVSPLMKTTTFINDLKAMKYAVESINELLHIPVLPETEHIAQVNDTTISVENVSFSYNQKEEAVLRHIDFVMKEGTVNALVGPSGGGKSTVARLIARFWDVTDGAIKIGGVNVKDIPSNQLSSLVCFVTQDNFLFNCSLKDNIRLGKPQASDVEVYAAAKAACCDDFIKSLPKGYNTPAGEAGKMLSGGEKQRIAIARAMLKNAPILILDEATAFTDPQNEAQIQKSIMTLAKGKTLLIIAHRLSTIKNADNIIVLQKGEVVASGKQDELIEKCPLYADMWTAHIGAKDWAVNGGGVSID